MRTTKQADPVRSVKVRSRKPIEVIEFKSACLGAPPAILANERAAAAVALEHFAFDGVGDVTRRRCVRGLGRNFSPLTAGAEALLLHLFDEQVERFLEDGRRISVRDSVAEQILRLAELVMTRPTRGELELERVLRERN